MCPAATRSPQPKTPICVISPNLDHLKMTVRTAAFVFLQPESRLTPYALPFDPWQLLTIGKNGGRQLAVRFGSRARDKRAQRDKQYAHFPLVVDPPATREDFASLRDFESRG